MGQYIEIQDGLSDITLHYSRSSVKRKSYLAKRRIEFLLFMSPIVFLISPLLGFLLLMHTVTVFYRDLYLLIFRNKKVFDVYYSFFSPGIDEVAFSIVGYKVEWNEVQEHITMINSGNKDEVIQKMAAKQKEMMHPRNRHRWVGLGKDTIVTHLIMNGKTGSGKTEAVRSVGDAVMRCGGGMGMNDGKSDLKMFIEIATQAKQHNRETSIVLFNYLKAELMAESNTINPVTALHPIRAVEFLGSLVKAEGQSDGTQTYFFNRGKVLLTCPINSLSLRRELANEPMDFDRIMEFRNTKALIVLYLLIYCMCRDLNTIIASNKMVLARLNSFRSTFTDPHLKYIHTLLDYVTQNPLEREFIEKQLNIKYRVIKELYANTYVLTKEYFSTIWNPWKSYLDVVGRALYAKGKIDNKVFFSANKREPILGFEAFKKDYYDYLKIQLNNKTFITSDEAMHFFSKASYYGFEMHEVRSLQEAFLRKKQEGGNIEDIPDDALQQHQYAAQQWDELSNVFTQYKHIFGQTRSEVDINRLVLDNKISYNLIPVLELDDKYINILGKISLMIIKEVAAFALGGQVISVHSTILNIMKDRFTPKPLLFEVLDEYNSYPISGVDKLLLQLRSINIGAALGIQNFAGLKAGGTDTTSQENSLGNALKWFTQTEDKTAIEWIKEMIGKDEVLKNEFQVDSFGNVLETASTRTEERTVFEAEQIRDFKNGFALILGGSTRNKIIPMQSFYRGGSSETIHIKRYSPITF